MPFSQRKDNVPKRCFPDNNLGQKCGIAPLSALCQKPDQLSSTEAFLDLSKQNPTHTCQLFFEPTQGCHKTVTASNRSGTPQSLSVGLCQHQRTQWSLLFGTPIFVSWVTQAKKLTKIKVQSLKNVQPQ